MLMSLSLPHKLTLGFTKDGKENVFYLNLNQYRNAHYHILNKAKIIFKENVAKGIASLPRLNKIELVYKLYPKSHRAMDVANICSVVDKFFCDALVELGKLDDDCYKFIGKVQYEFGEVDKMNPRVDVHIKELEPMKLVFDKTEILAALSMYASKLIAVADVPTIELEATADGSFIAKMEVSLADMQSSKSPAGLNKPASRAAVTEAIAATKEDTVAAKPSLLNKPEPSKGISIPKPKPVEEVAEAEPEQENPTEQEVADTADTTEATVDAPAEQQPESGTINGNTDAEPVQPTKSIFNFAKR